MKKVYAVTVWRQNAKIAMTTAMGGSCQICGYDRCAKALEFHHIDPNAKEKSFSRLMSAPSRLSEWYDELSKCMLLCANCHREVHAGVVDTPNDYFKFDPAILESLQKPSTRTKTPKGTFWITDGNINKKLKAGNTIPDGWTKGRTI